MRSIDQTRVSCGELVPLFSPGTPFHVEGCLIMQCLAGEAALAVDFKEHAVRAGDTAFLMSDNVIELYGHSEGFSIRYVTIPPDLFLSMALGITSQNFWDQLYLHPVQAADAPYLVNIGNWLGDIIRIYKSCAANVAETVVGNMVGTYLKVMESIMDRMFPDPVAVSAPEPWRIMQGFLNLLARHYAAEHSVAFYARALSVTPDYLSVVSRQTMGMPPKEMIEQKLVLAAKAMLTDTLLPIKSIADRLNYNDTSHLCKMFRRHCGMSPGHYRKKHRQPTRPAG